MNPKPLVAWGAVVLLVLLMFLVSHSLESRTENARAAFAHLSAKPGPPVDSAKAAIMPSTPPAQSSVSVQNAAQPAALTEAEALNNRAAARRVMLASWFDREYRPFIRTAMLSPTQTEAFRQAVISHWLRWSETSDVFREQHLAQNDPVVQKLGRAEWEQFTKESDAALGPAAAQALKEFNRIAPTKAASDTAGALVFDSGEPLRAEQAKVIIETIAANSVHYRKGGPASLDDVDIPIVAAQLKDVLTPVQLTALQTTLTARRAGAEVDTLIRAALQPSGNAVADTKADKSGSH